MSLESDPSIRALAASVVERLDATGATLAVAESCTGGWLGAAVTSIPGASAVFWGGVVAYADDAKSRLLGVDARTLREHGAVSEPTAREMAFGVVAVSGATWGIGITGVAGPDGGTESHPVGTVFVAISGPQIRCRALRFQGGREAIRRESVATALSMLKRELAADG